MKNTIIICMWVLTWLYAYYYISKHKLTLNQIVGFGFAKWNLYNFLSFAFPAYLVMHFYNPTVFVELQFFNVMINYFFMACLFWGLDQLPKVICYVIYKLIARTIKN